MTPSSEKKAPKLTRFLTFSIFVKNKIIRKQPVLNQQPSKLGIKVGGVLNSENPGLQLLFYTFHS